MSTYLVVNVFDEEVMRQEIPDHYLKDIEGYSKAENFEARKKIIDLHLYQLIHLDEKLFSEMKGLEFYIVFDSKMNFMTDAEIIKLLKTPDKKLIDETIQSKPHSGSVMGRKNGLHSSRRKKNP